MKPEPTGPLPLPLPLGHGLNPGQISVAPGQSVEHGNLVVSCPAGGQTCVLDVAADGSASYDRTGGMPSIMPAFAAQTLPPGHGLNPGQISVAPGQSMEHGNLVVSCPAGGQACVLDVAADGSASYDRTGGMPSIMPAFAVQTLPPGHGLAPGQISVDPGQSMEHANIVVSCPAGGQACVLDVAADGSASYDRTGGMPSIMPAFAVQTLPPGHGLNLGQISVDPGQSMEHGNVVVSCPAAGQACVLDVAADGSASYDRTGGMPSIMPAFAVQTLPPGHGLAPGQISVDPGQSMEHANIVVSCPAGGQACVLDVAADGSASYDRTGGMPSLRVLPLMAGPGQNLSDVSPIFARDETSTLKATLANPSNIIPVVSANIDRHRGAQQSVELASDFFVKSIRRNANRAYVIDYVLDGADEQVTIPLDDCTNGCRTRVNGRTFGLYADTGDDDDATTTEDGLGEFEYLAAHFAFYTPEDIQHRMRFVFGVRNENLPTGSATYHGRLSGDYWGTTDPDGNVRQRVRGTMRIVANFDMRALEGRVYRIQGTEHGADNATRTTWPTSSFILTDGRIVNGQFTAILRGVDDDPNTPLDRSVRGFIGDVLGEFYGPNAEEVGGVVTATRDLPGTADDRVLYAYIVGDKTDRLTGINDSEAFLTGFDRDDVADTMALTTIERPTVESTDDGYRITYVVDGQTQTLDFTESDFGANLSRRTQYSKTTNGTEYRHYTSTRSFYDRRTLVTFRPEHFDINGWVIINRDPSGTVTSVRYGSLVYGNRTTDMPTTGTASYDGRGYIRESPNDRALSTLDPNFLYHRTGFTLSADFGSSAITGNLTLLESRPGGDGDYATSSGGLTFNATIDGNGLSGTDLSGSGDLAGYSGGRVNGAFYGPEAAEVAGVFDAIHSTQKKHLNGYFGGQKQ